MFQYLFNFIEKIASEDIHHNAQQGSVVITTIKDQSHVMLKEQQQEPFENGQMSSAENSREDNGVEHTTAMTTQEISTAEKFDQNEQSSFVHDDVVCKVIIRNFHFVICFVFVIYIRIRERDERLTKSISFPFGNACRIFNKYIYLDGFE